MSGVQVLKPWFQPGKGYSSALSTIAGRNMAKRSGGSMLAISASAMLLL
jgi:hypothetical protein